MPKSSALMNLAWWERPKRPKFSDISERVSMSTSFTRTYRSQPVTNVKSTFATMQLPITKSASWLADDASSERVSRLNAMVNADRAVRTHASQVRSLARCACTRSNLRTWPRKLSVRCSADARAVVVVGTESEGSTTSVRPEGMACETATTLPSKSRATIESAFMSSADVIDVLIDSSDAPSNQPTVASFPYPRTTTVLRAAIWQRANTGRAGQRPVEQRCAS
mmetsp:Transcript_82097/g.232449  ORF Transcript_82097/g.232449 Transcript_82097/m.232449 type:complete len:223 (+) Transcript_82097:344-1012(+)